MPYEEFDPDDPMEMTALAFPAQQADLEAMAECLVEEFVRLGWDERRLMALFASPTFLGTHAIYRAKGEGYVRELIGHTIERWVTAGEHRHG